MTSRFWAAVAAAGSLLASLPVTAAVTYEGTWGTKNKFFSGNSLGQSCVSSGCHNASASGGYRFDSHADASANAAAAKSATDWAAGWTAMPYGSATQLPLDPDRNLLAAWIAGGKRNTAAATTSVDSGATSSSQYSVTFGGKGNGGGLSTAYYFDYGTTAGYGTSTTMVTPLDTGGGQSETATFSKMITGRACGTTYYFRPVAQSNGVGGATGSGSSVTTTACPGLNTISNVTTDEDSDVSIAVSSVRLNAGTTATYSLASPPAGMTINASSGVLSWPAASTPDAPTGNTDYSVTVNVTYTTSGSPNSTDSKTFNVRITPVNDAPVITSTTTGHTTATEDVPYTFDVNATDTENNTLTWDLVGTIPSGMSINPGTGIISWTPIQSTGNYSHSFTIRVTDNGTPTQSDTLPITINVAADNDAPTFTSDPSTHTTATEGVAYSYDVDASDPEGTALSYSLLVAPAGMNINSTTGVITWSPPQAAASYSANVTVRVSDTVNTPTQQSFTINVSADDDAPSFTSSDITTAAEQVNYSYDVNATDPEGQTLTYSLDTKPSGMTIDPGTGEINWMPPQAGATYTANVTVRIDDGSHQITHSFVITVTSSNDAPGFTSTDVTTATEGLPYNYDVNASDPEGGVLTYSLTVKPANMDIDPATGVITWTPPQATASYSANVTVRVTDGANPVSHAFVINVAADNDAPSFSSSPVTTLTEDSSYSYDVNATDPEGETLVYGLSTKPANMTIDSSTGVISWTPPANSNAAVNVVVTVRDSLTTVSQPFTISITPVNDAPTFTSTAITTLTEDTAYTYDVNATDVDGDTLTYSLTTAPSGMQIDSATGVITWTPPLNSNAAVNVVVKVQDNGTGTLSATQSFTISITPVNDAPVLTAIATQNQSTASFSLAPVASDPDNTTAQLAWSISGQPAGMSINAGSGAISWAGGAAVTCASQAACTYNVTVTVKDPALLSDSKSFSFVIVDGDGDTIPGYRDNCVATANTNQLDTDGDGSGDLCDSDADNDGIPNSVELANGLDPLNPADAAQDKDGDGLSNLQEYNACNTVSNPGCSNISIDSVPPVISTGGAVTVNAVAYYTPLVLSTSAVVNGTLSATALDGNDGVVVVSADKTGPFRPGSHTITWTASDKVGNSSTATQTLIVKPLLTLGGHVQTAAIGTIQVPVRLNGESAQYPVTVSYSATGTALSGTDYAALSGTLTFSDPETERQIPVQVLALNGNRSLTLTLQSITAGSAVLGASKSFILDITTQPLAPLLALRASQNGEFRQVVYKNQGTVTLQADFSDPNGDTPALSWNSGGVLATPSGNTLLINPAALAAGSYEIAASVTDSSGLVTTRRIVLALQDTAPTLSSADTDGDGIANNSEGSVDANGNGLLDYLEAQGSEAPESILLRLGSGTALTLMARTDSGLQLKAGEYAVAAQSATAPQSGIQVFSAQVANAAGIINDADNVAIGAIFNFEVTGLNAANRTAHVVLPLPIALTAGVQLRELSSADAWKGFSSGSGDEVRSAKRVNGVCPGPEDAAYVVGLVAGNDCLQLTLSDGGPNDADGVVNGAISVTAAPTVPRSVASVSAPTESQSGGSSDVASLLMLALGLLALRLRLNQSLRNAARSRSDA